MATMAEASLNGHEVATVRLDPWGGRQTTSFASRGRLASTVEVTMDEGGAVLKRRLTCGAPLSMALPHRVFAGIAARAVVDGDDCETVVLELMHADADLSVPLATWASFEEAAADWHSWARRTGLPMLLVAADGSAGVLVTVWIADELEYNVRAWPVS